MRQLGLFLAVLYLFNLVAAIVTVFHKKRSITSTLAWLLTLIFLPVAGFVVYAFCGRGVDGETIYLLSQAEKRRVKEIAHSIACDNDDPRFSSHELTAAGQALIRYFGHLEESPLTKHNQLEIITDGHEKFARLFADLQQATDHIHVEYYSFYNDQIGQRFIELLTEKAASGVEVYLIFDPWGSPKADRRFFAPLVAAGGHVTPFITARNLILKTRLNYHLHRKIVIIDGKISWTGGFNVGDQYLSRSPRFGYWRDTHTRIVGAATFSLQEIFIRDWNASVKKSGQKIQYEPRYFVFPAPRETGELSVQVVADGPDNEVDVIKGGFIRLIMTAQRSILIQTPYLVPDDSMIEALLNACRSGVAVKIMVPSMPDHPFIYRATQYYANYLHANGIEIYHYTKGFLHAKTLVIDEEIVSIGSTNQDIRSYSLNFESNIFVYEKTIALQAAAIFAADCQDSRLLTDEMIRQQSTWLTFKQHFSRLLSPIL